MAYHKSCLVLKNDTRFASSIYKDERAKKNDFNRFQLEGIYVFGGKNEECEVVSDLRVLVMGTKPLNWVYPSTQGVAPSPRYHHSMNFVVSMASVVIYGGRNDSGFPGFFSDIHILRLDTLTWLSCQIHGDELCRRSSHGVCVSGTQLFIFGGTNDEGYANTAMAALELDQTLAKEYTSKEKMLLKEKHLEEKENLPHHKKIQIQIEEIEKKKRLTEMIMKKSENEEGALEEGEENIQEKPVEVQEEETPIHSMIPLPGKGFSRKKTQFFLH